jgi:hypothetical protein
MHKPQDDNREENQAQAQSDAAPDAVAEGGDGSSPTDRVTSDAGGFSEADEAAGEQRKRIYKESGSPIVSRID